MLSPFSSAGTVPRRAASAALAFMLLCAAAPARAQQQQPPRRPADEDVITVESNLIQLNVGVADRAGRPVTTLARGDFAVFEDGVRQTIINFEPTHAPFSLVLMLDLSGSTLSFRTQQKMAALRFLDALGAEDRVAVVGFWGQKKFEGKVLKTLNRVETLAEFGDNRRKLANAIMHNTPNGGGDTNLYPALRSALSLLAGEGKRRKAVVVLTDGVDTGLSAEDRAAAAGAKTGEEAVAAVRPEANQTLNGVLNEADRLGVTIYPMALPSGDLKRITEHNRQIVAGYPAGEVPEDLKKLSEPTPQQVVIYTAARARLELLARRTGGSLYAINRLEDLGRQYAQVAAEMRTLYSIAYQSANASARDGRWRAVTIEVARPELVARTRPGYYAR